MFCSTVDVRRCRWRVYNWDVVSRSWLVPCCCRCCCCFLSACRGRVERAASVDLQQTLVLCRRTCDSIQTTRRHGLNTYNTPHTRSVSPHRTDYFARCEGSEYCDQLLCLYVCLSDCLSVCSHVSKTARSNFTKFCVRFTCGHGSVFSDGNAIRYFMYFRFIF